MVSLGVAGVIKIVFISLACGRVEYKLNQMMDKYKPKKKMFSKKRW